MQEPDVLIIILVGYSLFVGLYFIRVLVVLLLLLFGVVFSRALWSDTSLVYERALLFAAAFDFSLGVGQSREKDPAAVS